VTDVLEIMSKLEETGGRIALDGNRIRYTIPRGDAQAQRLIAELRNRRDDVHAALRNRAIAGKAPMPDPYQARLRAVLEQTVEPDYSMGMIPWLEAAAPDLYRDITSRLPDLIHELWTARAPSAEFEQVTAEWLAAHRKACALFRARNRLNET
jgi:hypothetical protein